jgi:hypothetical protein
MPSPIGHALGGIAAGCSVSGSPSRRRIAAFAIAGMLADVDFVLSITHRGPTHSLVAAAVVFAVAVSVLTWKRPHRRNLGLAMAIGLAYLSHLLFDWLGEDGGPPSGIMAMWPFSTAYYVSGLDVFNGIERRYWLPEFWSGNILSVLREILIVGPLAWLALRRPSRLPVPSAPRQARQ